MVAEIYLPNVIGTGYRTLQDICSTHYVPIFRFIRSRIGNEDIAAELTQTTFEKVIKKIDLFQVTNEAKDPRNLLRNWILTIAKNTTINYLRRNHLENNYTQNNAKASSENALTPENEYIAKEEQHNAHSFINDIANEGIKETARLWFIEDRTYSEICDIMDIPVGTVMSRLSRAREQIKLAAKKSI